MCEKVVGSFVIRVKHNEDFWINFGIVLRGGVHKNWELSELSRIQHSDDFSLYLFLDKFLIYW